MTNCHSPAFLRSPCCSQPPPRRSASGISVSRSRISSRLIRRLLLSAPDPTPQNSSQTPRLPPPPLAPPRPAPPHSSFSRDRFAVSSSNRRLLLLEPLWSGLTWVVRTEPRAAQFFRSARNN